MILFLILLLLAAAGIGLYATANTGTHDVTLWQWHWSAVPDWVPVVVTAAPHLWQKRAVEESCAPQA